MHNDIKVISYDGLKASVILTEERKNLEQNIWIGGRVPQPLSTYICMSAFGFLPLPIMFVVSRYIIQDSLVLGMVILAVVSLNMYCFGLFRKYSEKVAIVSMLRHCQQEGRFWLIKDQLLQCLRIELNVGWEATEIYEVNQKSKISL
jgi:hypothetical protein